MIQILLDTRTHRSEPRLHTCRPPLLWNPAHLGDFLCWRHFLIILISFHYFSHPSACVLLIFSNEVHKENKMTKALQCIPILCMHCLPLLIKVLKWMSAWIPSFICHRLQLLPGQKNLILEILRKELSSWAVQVWLSCGQLNFQFLQLLQKPDFFFYLKPISLLHLRYMVQLAAFTICEKKPLSLWSLPLSCVLPLTTTYDVPDCANTIVMPVMSGRSSVSQHHPALLFAQGQVH